MFNTPILLITFNRPSHTRRVLERILEAKPKDLYIFQDGAREGNATDVQKCQEVRDVINELITQYQKQDTKHQSPINVYRNYSDVNLGCGLGPYTAISWLFETEEYGIIMEDDILAHPYFFSFMDELLTRYKDNQRIGMVTGHNMQHFYSLFNSYYFTYRMDGTWGWGTWKRVWKDFKFDIPYDVDCFNAALKRYYHMSKSYINRQICLYQQWIGEGISRHSYWDYQFDYFLMQQGYLNIRPNSCLTSNIGTIGEATHIFPSSDRYLMDVNEKLFKQIKHPSRIKIDFLERIKIWTRTIKILLKI